MSLTKKRIYHFGQFELRVSARLLTRDGTPVTLGAKAFDVLTCLLARAGEVVTKDDLLRTVWPESFVEEGNLTQHIFVLRRALGDCAGYIVTLPGRGYQFTHPVYVTDELPPSPESGSLRLQRTRERTHVVIEESGPASGQNPLTLATPVLNQLAATSPLVPPDSLVLSEHSNVTVAVQQGPAHALPPPPRRRRYLTATAAVLIGAAAVWFAWIRTHIPHFANQRVVLAELDNHTGDPGFDVVLRNALQIDLDQSPYMELMGQPEELATLGLMNRPPETALTPAVARELCVRSNRQVLITGAIATVGQRYLLTLEATDCDSGKILAGAKAVAEDKDHTLQAMDQASATLRHGLGESAASLERFHVPVAQATTSSLEALKQYSIGEYLLGRMGKEQTEVLPFFQRAVELDPTFAMASAAIATGYFSLEEYELAAPHYQKAFDLSGHVSEKERLYIRAHYFADDKHDLTHGIEAYRQWAATYPRDWGPWLNLANAYSQLGQYPAAIEAASHALALDPTRGIIYTVLARNSMYAGQYDQVKETGVRALGIHRDSVLLHETLFETALLQHDAAAQDELAQLQAKDAAWELLDLQARAAASQGQYRRASQLFRAAFDAANARDLSEKAQGILLDQATVSLDLGLPEAARNLLHRLGPRSASSPQAALLAAGLGDLAGAQHTRAAAQDPSYPNTLMQFVYAPRIRARIALQQSKPVQAIAELEPVAPYNLAEGLAGISTLAQAYLAANQPEQAVQTYRQLLAHAGVDPISPLIPLATLGLARAQASAGDTIQARAAYQTFFTQWPNADPDLPILLSARKEYAALPHAPNPQ